MRNTWQLKIDSLYIATWYWAFWLATWYWAFWPLPPSISQAWRSASQVCDLPPLLLLPVPELFAKNKPFFYCLLGEHCLLCSNPGWQAELVLEDFLDSSHQNVALPKYFVVQLTSCLKGFLLTKRLILVIIFCGSLLSWWRQSLQDSDVLPNSTGSTAQMCSDLCRFDSFLQPSHYLCLFFWWTILFSPHHLLVTDKWQNWESENMV